MHAMSYRSYSFLACSSGVNIEEPVLYSTIMSQMTVSQPELHSLQLLTWCRIHILQIPHCQMLWDLPKMNFSSIPIWSTMHCISYSMLGELRWMSARSIQLLGILSDLCLHGNSICTAVLHTPGALVSYVSFVMKFFVIHQNLGPAQSGNSCGQRRKSLSSMNYQSRMLLNWQVQRLMNQYSPYWRDKEVIEFQWYNCKGYSHSTFYSYVY